MNTTNNNDALTLAAFLAMSPEDRADVDYTQAPALYAQWCERYGVHVEPHHVQQPGADAITYRVRIWAPGEGAHPAREMWIDYSMGVGLVQHKDGTPAPYGVTYDPRTGTMRYRRHCHGNIYWVGDADAPDNPHGIDFGTRTHGPIVVKKPTAADILWCLRSDADALNYDRYEDWAADMGYDPDSREGERTYKACRENGVELRRVVGPEAWAVLLDLPGL